MSVSHFLLQLSRRKTLDDTPSQLARVLKLVDLVALGVGATLGLGVYLLAGVASRKDAGPAVVISFLIAAVASAVAGLCYAEFAGRVPKAGSAYVYSYVTVGEFVAFIIGWNLILEYVLGTASVARGLSGYLDTLCDGAISKGQKSIGIINVEFLAEYPDFLALGFILLLTVLLSLGVKESTRLNNVFSSINLLTIAIVIVAGAVYANPTNWNIDKNIFNSTYINNNGFNIGEGGFAPFGFSGIMAGAARVFYGFVGFDGIATTGEEAINPQRDIPLAIVICLLIIFLSYFGISTVLTLMWPYYDQDEQAPVSEVFRKVDLESVRWIVNIGAVSALCTSLLGAMFPLPRVIYAMARDGLIFKIFARVNNKLHTPIYATLLSGILTGLMATLFDLDELMDMMSIGTLFAYTIVALCVLVLRYKPSDEKSTYSKNYELKHEASVMGFIKVLFNLNNNKHPNTFTSLITNWSIGIFSILSFGFCAILIFALDIFLEAYCLALFLIFTILMITLLVIIIRQPVSDEDIPFKVPLLPYIPCASIIINVYLMLKLSPQTWYRLIGWLAVGFLIYFFYGLKHSEERKLKEKNTTQTELNIKKLPTSEQDVTQF